MHPQAKPVLKSLFPAPSWFAQTVDASGEWVRLLRFTEADYRRAAFLDHRGLREGMPYCVVGWDDVARMVPATARRDAHWIFHLGRVGSTLVSRLLGEIDRTFCIREPSLLAKLPSVPESALEERLPIYRALLSRCFRPKDRAVIKSTSGLNDFAASLIGPREEGGRAILLRSDPERFIAARLAGDRVELRQRGPVRVRRLKSRAPAVNIDEAMADDVRLAAATWATEASALEVASQATGADRALFVSFDRFIADPLVGLAEIAAFLGFNPSDNQLERIVTGSLLKQDSKRGSHFDADERRRNVDRVLNEHRSAIGGALDWLNEMAATSPSLRAALERKP